MVLQHVPGQDHAGWPRLATAAGREVFVDLEGRRKQAAKIQSGVTCRLVLWQGREILVKGERVEVLRAVGGGRS